MTKDVSQEISKYMSEELGHWEKSVRTTRERYGKDYYSRIGAMNSKGRPQGFGTKSRLYSVWGGMKGRCLRSNHEYYKNYGGRGIKVCDRWLDYDNFLADMGGTYAQGLTLDRKDNDGNYEPSNCRWATRKEQNNNRRDNRRIKYNGETKNIYEWATELGFKRTTISQRLNAYGWTVERAFTTPTRKITRRSV